LADLTVCNWISAFLLGTLAKSGTTTSDYRPSARFTVQAKFKE
jgi:hypothetical protein